MKHFAKKIILGLGLLTACLLPVGASAREFPRFEWHHLTGIVGRLDFSTQDLNVGLSLQTESGTTVAVISNFAVPGELQQPNVQYITISQESTFVVFLKPGHYVLRGAGSGIDFNLAFLIPAKSVTIDRDRLTVVDVKL